MPLFLVDHLDGCTPLEPCKSCQAAAFLKLKLQPEDFDLLIQLADGTAINKASPETPIRELGLSVRTFNCLNNDNLKTLGELVQRSEIELMRIPNLGRLSLKEIKEVLQRKGYRIPRSHD